MTIVQVIPTNEDRGRPCADRVLLRQRLLTARERFTAGSGAAAAQATLTAHLARLLHELEPSTLGLYWPVRGEFSPCEAVGPADRADIALALPFAQRTTREMHYRPWNGERPETADECGVPAPATARVVVPDVVLVPCVGFTRSGWRLGYGGGFFDRWLALHPHVTAVGVGWSASEIAEADWQVQPHDQPLALIVTESGIVA